MLKITSQLLAFNAFNEGNNDKFCKDVPDLFDPSNVHWRHALHVFSVITLSVCLIYLLIMILTTTRMCVRRKITFETKLTLIAKYVVTILLALQLSLFLVSTKDGDE